MKYLLVLILLVSSLATFCSENYDFQYDFKVWLTIIREEPDYYNVDCVYYDDSFWHPYPEDYV